MGTKMYKVSAEDRGEMTFASSEAADVYVAKLDELGVKHGSVVEVDVGIDPELVRGIGGG